MLASLLTKIKHMAHSSTHYRTAFLGTTFVFGTQLLSTRQAIAHSAHYESEEAEQTTSKTDSEQPDLSTESAAISEEPAKAVTPEVKADSTESESNAVPANESLDRETAVREVPVAQEPVNTSRSGLLDSFSIGLGETLLAFIVVGPFLLCFWKK